MKLVFSTWLKNEMDNRAIGLRELARLADISPSAISRVINQSRNAGPEFCSAIARAMDLPEEEVFRQAGLLQQSPADFDTAMSIYHIVKRLPLDQQKAILTQLKKNHNV